MSAFKEDFFFSSEVSAALADLRQLEGMIRERGGAPLKKAFEKRWAGSRASSIGSREGRQC